MNDPGLDATLDLLASGTRRDIIHVLRDTTGEITIDDLAERLAADGQLPETDSRRPSIKLYHSDLMKLNDYGLVDFDYERGTVRYQSNEYVERVMDSLPSSERRITLSMSSD